MLCNLLEDGREIGSLVSEALPALERTLQAENRDKVLRYVGLTIGAPAR